MSALDLKLGDRVVTYGGHYGIVALVFSEYRQVSGTNFDSCAIGDGIYGIALEDRENLIIVEEDGVYVHNEQLSIAFVNGEDVTEPTPTYPSHAWFASGDLFLDEETAEAFADVAFGEPVMMQLVPVFDDGQTYSDRF